MRWAFTSDDNLRQFFAAYRCACLKENHRANVLSTEIDVIPFRLQLDELCHGFGGV